MILISLISINQAEARSDVNFNKKHYLVIKSVVWAADKVEVPRALLLALCWGEGWASKSMGKDPTHMDGDTLSYGICQVKLETAEWMDKLYKHKIKATPSRLEDPKINAFYAAKYLKYQLKQYDNSWQLAVDAYNKGSAAGNDTIYVRHFNESLKLINSNVKYGIYQLKNIKIVAVKDSK